MSILYAAAIDWCVLSALGYALLRDYMTENPYWPYFAIMQMRTSQ